MYVYGGEYTSPKQDRFYHYRCDEGACSSDRERFHTCNAIVLRLWIRCGQCHG